jgi:hypothetical protein
MTTINGTSVRIPVRPNGGRNPGPLSAGQTWSAARPVSVDADEDALWWHDNWRDIVFKPFNPEGVEPLEGDLEPNLAAWSDPGAAPELYPLFALSIYPPTPEQGGEWTTVKWNEDGEEHAMLVQAGPLGIWGIHPSLGMGEIPPGNLVSFFRDQASEWISHRSRREDVQSLLNVRTLWEQQQRQQLPSWITAVEVMLDLDRIGGDQVYKRSAER